MCRLKLIERTVLAPSDSYFLSSMYTENISVPRKDTLKYHIAILVNRHISCKICNIYTNRYLWKCVHLLVLQWLVSMRRFCQRISLQWEKFCNISESFKRGIGIPVKCHILTGILTKIDRAILVKNPLKCVNLLGSQWLAQKRRLRCRIVLMRTCWSHSP